jgi:dienelactone hydrolase
VIRTKELPDTVQGTLKNIRTALLDLLDQSTMFGPAADAPIGEERLDTDGNVWQKLAQNGWHTASQNLANTTWSDDLMQQRTKSLILSKERMIDAVWHYQHGVRFVQGARAPEFAPLPRDPAAAPGSQMQYRDASVPALESALHALWDELPKIEQANHVTLYTLPKSLQQFLPDNVLVWAQTGENYGDAGLAWDVPTDPVLPSLVTRTGTAVTPVLGGAYPSQPQDLTGLCSHPLAHPGLLCSAAQGGPSSVGRCPLPASLPNNVITLTSCQADEPVRRTIAGPDSCKDVTWPKGPLKEVTRVVQLSSLGARRFEPIAADTYPAILLLPGSGDPEHLSDQANTLAQQGYVVLALPAGSVSEAAIAQSFNLLHAWADVDTLRIGVLAFGDAATTAMSFAQHHPETLAAVVEINGKVSGKPAALPSTLLLHGGQDASSPLTQVHSFDTFLTDHAIPHQLQVYPAQGHVLGGDAWIDAWNRAQAFLKTTLARGDLPYRACRVVMQCGCGAPSGALASTLADAGRTYVKQQDGTINVCVPDTAGAVYEMTHELVHAYQTCNQPTGSASPYDGLTGAEQQQMCCHSEGEAQRATCKLMEQNGLLKGLTLSTPGGAVAVTSEVCGEILANDSCQKMNGAFACPLSKTYPPSAAATLLGLQKTSSVTCSGIITNTNVHIETLQETVEQTEDVCPDSRFVTYPNTVSNNICYTNKCAEHTLEMHRTVPGRTPMSVMDEAFPWDTQKRSADIIQSDQTETINVPAMTRGFIPSYNPGQLVAQLDAAVCQVQGLPPLQPAYLCTLGFTDALNTPLAQQTAAAENIANNLIGQQAAQSALEEDFEAIGARIGAGLYAEYLRDAGSYMASLLNPPTQLIKDLRGVQFPSRMCPL